MFADAVEAIPNAVKAANAVTLLVFISVLPPDAFSPVFGATTFEGSLAPGGSRSDAPLEMADKL
ncbi:MAG: hypothetical protein DHS20C14_02740 [Phycisphaeraceae bacterium]|nr:MAG: hypothetical protein DHS20C14_02740 [Phycisphaeraceae bacterium]